MSKYIIEIEDEPFGRNDDPNIPRGMDELYKAKGFKSLVFDQFGLDKLTPLDKELEEAYQKGVHDGSLDVKERVEGAYQKGYEVGQHEATTLEYQQGLEEGKKQAKVQAHLDVCHDIDRVAHGNYQKGLDDAWEAITKIAKMPDGERYKVFGDTWVSNILNKYSVSEIINILDGNEPEQDEIKVGDEVEDETGEKLVIAHIDPSTKSVCAIGGDGCTYGFFADNYKKTGKHYSQIEELLEAMKEGAE